MFFIAYALSHNEMRRSLQGTFSTDPVRRERKRRRGRRAGV
jgi:hypothetical protein